MSVYLIVRNVRREDYDGPYYWDEEIEPEHGYFTSLSAAVAKAEELTAPGAQRYEEALRKYQEGVEEERAKTEQARALGFRHQGYYPLRPDPADFYTAIKIEEAS